MDRAGRPPGREDFDVPDELLWQCRRGEDSAWEELFDWYHPRVRRYVLYVLGPVEDVEDLVQAVFIEIAKSLKRFRGESSFSAWAFGIVRRVAEKYLRDRTRAARGRWAASEWLRVFPPTWGEPLLGVEGREAARVALGVLEKMSEDQREVWMLSEVEGMDSHEIGRMLRIPMGTVRSRLHHARERILEALEGSGVLDREEVFGSRILPFERRLVARDAAGDEAEG